MNDFDTICKYINVKKLLDEYDDGQYDGEYDNDDEGEHTENTYDNEDYNSNDEDERKRAAKNAMSEKEYEKAAGETEKTFFGFPIRKESKISKNDFLDHIKRK